MNEPGVPDFRLDRIHYFLRRRKMSEEEKKTEVEQMDPDSKRDFLKTLGAGIGLAGLASFMGGQAMAQSEKKNKYVIVITHGGNDPNRAIFGLLMAETVADKGWGQVFVWMTLDGADLVNKKKTERIDSPIYKKFGNALSIMKKIKDKGGWFGVCPPCAEYFGATGGDKYDWVELAGGDWLMKNIQDAWVVWI
jgi:predicted peroxiredoxin